MHTKGPWTYIPSKFDDEHNCIILDPEIELGDGSHWIVGNDDDARLIAAAPELLEECQYMNDLLKRVSIIAYTPEVLPYLSAGLKAALVEFVKQSHVDVAIAKAAGKQE